MAAHLVRRIVPVQALFPQLVQPCAANDQRGVYLQCASLRDGKTSHGVFQTRHRGRPDTPSEGITPACRLTGGYTFRPSLRKAGFSKNSLKDSKSRSQPTFGKSGIICAMTCTHATPAFSSISSQSRVAMI